MIKKFLTPIAIIAILWALFQLYLAGIGPMTAQIQRSVHVAFALALTFLLVRRGKDSKVFLFRYFDFVLVAVSLASGAYVYLSEDRLVARTQFVSELSYMDYFFGIVIVLLVLEASRRLVGKTMTILAAVFIFYAFFGNLVPGLLNHSGLDFKQMVEIMFLSADGILGVPTGVSVDYVFYFIMFAAFLEISGGGRLFIDLAFKITGRMKGGPAKAAIMASGGMGTISGSAVGNVASTGVFTIPLMKRAGYTPKFAASIEALASTGGQILPPIMGAAAFLLADTVGVPYTEVILSALIPALLFYMALLIMVHLQAIKGDVTTYSRDVQTKKESVLKRIHLLLPLGLLVFLIFSGATLQSAAFWSILSVIGVSYIRKETRFSLTNILDGLVQGSKQAVQVAIPCAVAGIVVGVVTHSGLGMKLGNLIINASFGIPVLSAILVAIGCIILGMGMPTTSAYIMGAMLLAPSLISLDFHPVAAQLFVLYFAVLSMITPPIALATYSAATIAKTDTNTTGFYAFFLGIPLYLIPFAFLFNPAMLLYGEISSIIWVTFTTTIGLFMLSSAVIGYLFDNLGTGMRWILMILSACLIIPEGFTDIIGVIFAGIIILWKKRTVIEAAKNNSKKQKMDQAT
ncbi:TRAP transporter fused permease subunit [Alteribacillus sp. YIM 98480]|uniref:TRAP transporter permease n=1 Tax=Alteribacillus sp. YIM 98480 TaxID=2606599 RepID=UPI00131E4164|nr:TRAP transporter fused permease subunit [Alteribacillus sp. YIM 98480]